jgi:galactoside O-acetyltransferase
MIRQELRAWCEEIIRRLPGSVGRRTRSFWLGRALKRLGAAPSFDMGIVYTAGENIAIGNNFSMMRNGSLHAHGGAIQIGDRVSINSNVCLGAADGGRITIGSDVLIGQNTVLRASSHVFADVSRPIKEQGHSGGSIVIEDDVWLGANVVVVAGVTIGAHSVVGAGAVVTADVEPWSVVGGVPARLISKRKN